MTATLALVDAEVERRQAAATLEHVPLVVGGVLLSTPPIVLLLREAIPTTILHIWGGLQVAVALAMLALYLSTRPREGARRPSDSPASLFPILNGLLGLSTGVGFAVMYTPHRLDLIVFMGGVLMVMGAISAGIHAIHRPANLAFLLTALPPYILRLLLDDGLYQQLLAVTGVIGLVFFLLTGRLVERRTAAAFRLQIEHEGLLADQNRRADALAAGEQRLRAVMNAVDDAILVLDSRGRVVEQNEAARKLAGDNLIGQPLALRLPSAAQPDFAATPATERSFMGATGMQPVEVAATPIQFAGEPGLMVVMRDLSERKAQQAAMIQSSKLASLGEIATGLAHEINQPLNIIRMAADSTLLLLADGNADDDFIKSQLGLISGQTVRTAKIIEHMRVFGRKDDADAVTFAPMDCVQGALGLVAQQLRVSDIDVELAAAPDCPPVRGWPVRLEQVLLNLLNNARDAVLARPQTLAGRLGTIHIAIRHDAARGEVLIEVGDTGGGIEADQIGRVFDPFFTTKDAGKGTGLGLSISYAIIADMGGRLSVANGPDGAIFTIALPALAPARRAEL